MDEARNMKEVTMSNHQSDRMGILERLDEINRMEERTTDTEMLKYLEDRKKELRDRLTTTI